MTGLIKYDVSHKECHLEISKKAHLKVERQVNERLSLEIFGNCYRKKVKICFFSSSEKHCKVNMHICVKEKKI